MVTIGKRGFCLTVALAALLGLSLNASAGTLEPPASAVDGAGSPAPTTPAPPSWSQKLPAAERFVLVLDNEAVLDRETGLVWEKAPDATGRSWQDAINHCVQFKALGGRVGWRLPRIEELASLIDLSQGMPNPRLSPGHPFTGVQGDDGLTYWSATEIDPNNVYTVEFFNGARHANGKLVGPRYTWCVRSQP